MTTNQNTAVHIEAPAECLYCGATSGISHPETWRDIPFHTRNLFVPRCRNCLTDQTLINRLKQAIGLRKPSTVKRDVTPSALCQRYPFLESVRQHTERADRWASSDNSRIDSGGSAVSSAAGQPGSVTFVQAANPKDWPSGWRDVFPGGSTIHTLKWDSSDTPLAANVEGFVRQIDAWLGKNKTDNAIKALFILYAQVVCLENLAAVLKEAVAAVSVAKQFIQNGSARCFLCGMQDNHPSGCNVIIGHRIAPKVVDVFGRIGGANLGLQYNLPNVAIIEDVVKKSFGGLVGEVREALMSDFETTGMPVRIATEVLVVGEPAEMHVCRFCAALPHISRSASGSLTLEKAVTVAEGLWAIPPQKFALGLTQIPVAGFPSAELREFGRFTRPDPTR